MTPQEAVVAFMEQYRAHVKPLIDASQLELAAVRFRELYGPFFGLYAPAIEKIHSGGNFLGYASLLESVLKDGDVRKLPEVMLRLEAYAMQTRLRGRDTSQN